MEQREANGLFGVTFAPEEHDTVRQWVQDRASQEIVSTPTRLYLPVGVNGMAQVDPGDIVWWDPEGLTNAFSVERNL